MALIVREPQASGAELFDDPRTKRLAATDP
jgi:hypothetical protein